MSQANSLTRALIVAVGACVGFGLGFGIGIFIGEIVDAYDPKHYIPGALVTVPLFALLGLAGGINYALKYIRRAS